MASKRLSLPSDHLGHVDVKEADRIRVDFFLPGLVSFDLRQTAVP